MCHVENWLVFGKKLALRGEMEILIMILFFSPGESEHEFRKGM